jgi:hypothetical protein
MVDRGNAQKRSDHSDDRRNEVRTIEIVLRWVRGACFAGLCFWLCFRAANPRGIWIGFVGYGVLALVCLLLSISVFDGGWLGPLCDLGDRPSA